MAEPKWGWRAGSSDEWFDIGPFETRDAVIAEGRFQHPDERFHIAECREEVFPSPDADGVIDQLLDRVGDDSELFDGDSVSADRVGDKLTIEMADTALQGALDVWMDVWRHTFTKPNIFMHVRNSEWIEPIVS